MSTGELGNDFTNTPHTQSNTTTMAAISEVVNAALILAKMGEEKSKDDFNTPQINLTLFQVSGFAEAGPVRHDFIPETTALTIHSFLEFLVGRDHVPRDLASLQPLLARCVSFSSSLSISLLLLLTLCILCTLT